MPALTPDRPVPRPLARSASAESDSSRTEAPVHSPAGDSTPSLGHNAAGVRLQVELRLFNRLYRRFGNGVMVRRIDVPAGTTLGELLAEAGIPTSDVFIAFVNGRDVSAGPGELRTERALEEGDVVALSGPVPYSWGYGAPVV